MKNFAEELLKFTRFHETTNNHGGWAFVNAVRAVRIKEIKNADIPVRIVVSNGEVARDIFAEGVEVYKLKLLFGEGNQRPSAAVLTRVEKSGELPGVRSIPFADLIKSGEFRAGGEMPLRERVAGWLSKRKK